MRINEDFLDDEQELSLSQSDDVKLNSRGEYHDYPFRLGFCYYGTRYRQMNAISAKVEEYLDTCPYITEFSKVEAHPLPHRFNSEGQQYIYINFGFEHKFRNPSQIFRVCNVISHICFTHPFDGPLKVDVENDKRAFTFQYMEEMNTFVQNEYKFDTKDDQETIATDWREFFTFCCIILPQTLDVYSLMQKSFPTKYDVREYKQNFVAYMNDNYNAKHTKMTIADRFLRGKRLSISRIINAVCNYDGILNTIYFQEEVEGFLHSKVEYENKALEKLSKEFNSVDELDFLEVRRDRFVFPDALSNQTVENLEWLSFYLGISKRDDNTYHYNTFAVSYTGMNYVNVLSLILE